MQRRARLCVLAPTTLAVAFHITCAHCAKCHGDTGDADSAAAKKMKAPAIAGDAKLAGISDADLMAKIKGAKKHGKSKSLSDADLAAAATSSRQLAGAK